MRAMILAAGRGERLRPLTDKTPKPLVMVGNEPPLLRHLRRLAESGFCELVVNLSHLGGQIRAAVMENAAAGVSVQFSEEPQPLGAAGGIRLAMERGFLTAPFLLINGDIICDYDLQNFRNAPTNGAHLLLVDNPPEKNRGDFTLQNGVLQPPQNNALTYAGMGVYNPSLFAALPPGKFGEFLPVINQAMAAGVATGNHYRGRWHDIGTEKSLTAARADSPPARP